MSDPCGSFNAPVTWHTPKGEVPDGLILVEVDLASGESDVAIVYIDDEDGQTLKSPDGDDVWTAWLWMDVNRYAYLDEVLVDKTTKDTLCK